MKQSDQLRAMLGLPVDGPAQLPTCIPEWQDPRLTVSAVGGMTSEDNWESIRQAYDAGIATKERERVLREFEAWRAMNWCPKSFAALIAKIRGGT